MSVWDEAHFQAEEEGRVLALTWDRAVELLIENKIERDQRKAIELFNATLKEAGITLKNISPDAIRQVMKDQFDIEMGDAGD